MLDITAHVMVRNEEYWVGYILEPLAKTLDKVLVADTGSKDDTVKVVRELMEIYDNISLLTYDPMTPAINGQCRQFMTDLTKTAWAMIVDGDEYYDEEALEAIKNIPVPLGGKLGFTTLQVLQYRDGKFYKAEKWSKQALFHAPTTTWRGAYPFEGPNWYDIPATYFYFPSEIEGLDFHHLARSRKDGETLHRHDTIRPPQLVKDEFTLPIKLGRWPNPYVRGV